MFFLKKFKIVFIIIAVLFAGSYAIRLYNIHRFRFEEKTGFMMDTFVTIRVQGPSAVARKAISDAFDRMQEIDKKMNALNPESPVYAFNEKGVPVADPEIVELVQKGLEISKLSSGAFDMTLLPLSKLWGFDTKSPHLPPDREIKEALAKTGYKYLTVKDGKVNKLRPYITLDLGGIAKGYAVGEALRILKKEGITSGLIDAGGDIYALGKRKDGKPWKVGIKAPREEGFKDGVLGYLELSDISIATSGDYERFFIKDGKRYHHIFDSTTGYPANSGLISASIIYGDCALTDVWTKVLFVSGPEKGLRIVEAVPGLGAIMVTTEGKILYSKNLKNEINKI
jgi:FAD:protein FMN transferase